MRERINKPRVFLSHSRLDVPFIERIETDFRRCQIDSWRDQNEIRDGRPWLESIFEDGIPTCDAILAYFTDNALNSQMVAKEVDSAILRRLHDSNIAFLPYVDVGETRAKLRLDIQTLQTREWNEENYYEILPSVVAEIWRSFLERNIANAVSVEKTRRLELELELQRVNEKVDTPFSPREEKDFTFVHSRLNRRLEVAGTIREYKYNEAGEKTNMAGDVVAGYETSFNLFPVLCVYSKHYFSYDKSYFRIFVSQHLNINKKAAEQLTEYKDHAFWFEVPNLLAELQTYGLLDREQRMQFDRLENVYYFSDKMQRFSYWSEFHGLIPEEIELDNFQVVDEETLASSQRR